MRAINDLLQHPEFGIRELGQKAVRYRNERTLNELTESEYADLCRQLTDLDALERAADSAEERQALAAAVQFLATYLPVVL